MLFQLDNYLFQFRKFTAGHNFYHGLLSTVSIAIPVIVLGFLGQLQWGLAMALGALCLTIVDNPGPQHHRQNAMLFTIFAIFLLIIITGWLLHFEWLLMIWLALATFSFSMVAAFGTRSANVGSACLLMMVLSLDEQKAMSELLITAAFASLGGTVYFLLSSISSRLMPYKLAQQVLGDCLHKTAEFLQQKSAFYDPAKVLSEEIQKLNAIQVEVHESQQVVRDILFKTREFVRESTHNGRVLLMIFLEAMDLFENVLSSQQDYGRLRKTFQGTGILEAFEKAVANLSAELDKIALAVQLGRPAENQEFKWQEVHDLKNALNMLKHRQGNRNDFTGLEQVYQSIVAVTKQIDLIRTFSTYHPGIKVRSNLRLQQFVDPTRINWRIFRNNLNFESNVFRHSIRVSAAVLAGFLFAQLLPVGHFYWILLTVTVIVKPAYALTKQRNKERLLGTLFGAIIGMIVIAFINNTTVLTVIVLFCMIVTFSLIRVRYLPAVIFMTIYLIIALELLNYSDSATLFADRVLDTFIGGMIAWAATLAIPPLWEKTRINGLLADCLAASRAYFEYLTGVFMGDMMIDQEFKIRRKKNYVALANLNDAFRSMMNEPSRRRTKGDMLHELVVGCHMFIAYLATYRDYAETLAMPDHPIDLAEPGNEISDKLLRAEKLLREDPENVTGFTKKIWNPEIREPVFGQLELLNRTSADILRVTRQMVSGNPA